jgi:hypothetical protein
LRYGGVIPVDLPFYDTAEACKLARKPETALLYLNRFVDAHEVMKNGDLSITNIKHQRFEPTDVPREICLRKHLSGSETDSYKNE